MKKVLTLIAICAIHVIFNFAVIGQEFELTPSIPVKPTGNKSAAITKNQSQDVRIGNAYLKENILKSANTSQINYSWGRYLSTSNVDRFFSTTIDEIGNVIAVGSKGESSSDVDAVIYKFDNWGNLLWSDTPGKSSDYDGIYDVVTDKFGNIYITGEFYSSAFDYEIYSNGSSDIFIAKYNSDGTLLWANSAGGNDEDYGCGIALDDVGNVYVVGFFNGTSYWDDIAKTSSSQGDMFIAKYDVKGNVKWVRKGDIGESNYIFGIGVDKTGNAYVSAKFSNDVHFEGAQIFSSKGGEDMILIKYDTSGSFKWIKSAGGIENDGGNSTIIDTDGNILIAGFFSDAAIFENKKLTAHGTVDIFAAKYSPNGNLIWVKQFGGTGSQTAWKVASDEKNNCYVTGWFSGTGAFDNTTIISSGGSDAYLIKYDKNGNLIWVEPTATGLDEQVGSGVFIKANDIAISGYYEEEMYIQNKYFPNEGGKDAYLAKLVQDSDAQQTVYVNPNLFLSTSLVKTGQSIIFTGKQFSPAGKVDLNFSGPEILTPIADYTVDVYGNFSYILTISSSQTIGNYKITATDKISGKSVTRTFQIISNQTVAVDDFLKILEPGMPMISFVGDQITLSWEDKVKFNVNTSFNFKHSYKVESQKDNEPWQLVTNILGNNSGHGNLNLSTAFTPTHSGMYKLKVTDNYYSGRSAITPEITVNNSIISDIKIEYIWDDSYSPPENGKLPDGVAADGVARFYIVVSNTNQLGSSIQKVKISITDLQGYESTQFLGKVMRSSHPHDKLFFTEANSANSIIAENSVSNDDGKFWFWYVAPDDFSRNEGDWDEGERDATATFEVMLLNGNKLKRTKSIKIVRPPLMLVHGLIGDPSTWNNFPTGTNGKLFINDETRFKIRKAVRLGKVAFLNVNSSILLGEGENSFKGLIRSMRNLGFACNQIDYVCHSMGGSVFRNTVTYFDSYYKGKSNYGKGYAHKFISLNTPHQGSSLANLLCDVAKVWPLTGPIVSLGAVKELFEVDFLKIKAADAVEDLKYKKGIKFGISDVPSHLIGSGVPGISFNAQSFAIYELLKTYLSSFVPGSGILPFWTWYQTYFNLFGYEPDFMAGSDAIVSLTSQFSGYGINSLPSYCSNIPGLMHNSIFGDSPTTSPEVGKKVDELLNRNINSSFFYSLPATGSTEKKSSEKKLQQEFVQVENKVKILYPANNANYHTGDTLTVKLLVDTLGLKSFAMFFQDQSFFDLPVQTNVEYKLIVSPEYIEGQYITTVGNYLVSDTLFLSSENASVKVNPTGSLIDFKITPDVIMIEKNKTRRPIYEAIYNDAIAVIGQTDLFSISIRNPDIVSYDSITNQFTGLSKGSTSATISYRGKSSTVFFEVIEYEEPVFEAVTGINDIEFDNNAKNQLNVKTYPNPFSESLTFEYTLPNIGDTRLEIIDIYGQTVKILIFDMQSKGKQTTTIDLTGLADGIYIYKLSSGNIIHNGKILKKSEHDN